MDSIQRLVILLSACALGTSPAAEDREPRLPTEIPVLTKGDFIFFSHAVFQKPTNEAEARVRQDRLDWIKRFRICLTNGYDNFAGQDLQELHAAGCELFVYRWFNGYLRSELLPDDAPSESKAYYGQFSGMVKLFRDIHAHPEWLLNSERPIQGGARNSRPISTTMPTRSFERSIAHRSGATCRRRITMGSSSTISAPGLCRRKSSRCGRRNIRVSRMMRPALEFLKELREALGTKRIFGNQAYRASEEFYDLIDYDCSESLATSFVWGKEAKLFLEEESEKTVRDTFYRPWDGPNGYKEAARERLATVAKKPRVRVCDINYLLPWRVPTGRSAEVGGQSVPVFTQRTDRPAIFYGYAISKLVGGYTFASDWYAEGYGQDGVYFLDLGEPIDKRYVETPEAVARYYQNGFVVVTRAAGRVVFQPDPKLLPPTVTDVWDVYEGTGSTIGPVSTLSRSTRPTILPRRATIPAAAFTCTFKIPPGAEPIAEVSLGRCRQWQAVHGPRISRLANATRMRIAGYSQYFSAPAGTTEPSG